MRSIISKLRSPSSIPHLRLELPQRQQNIPQTFAFLDKISPKSPALFISILGMSEDPQTSTSLYEMIQYTSNSKKVQVYTFLQDNINGLSYYIASAGNRIIANPFCRIGDITAPNKSYKNISKLLQYFGISLERIGTQGGHYWNHQLKPTEREAEFTKNWLQIVENKLKKQIPKNRNVDRKVIEEFGNKLILPKKALQLKLIDEIGTVDSFKQQRFPNNEVKTLKFSVLSGPAFLNTRQTQVLNQMVTWMSMPKGVLLACQDPINEYINNFVEIIQARLESPQKMQQLQKIIQGLLTQFQSRVDIEHGFNF